MPKHAFTEDGRLREEVLRMISDIFRVIAKPVDKDSLQDLAPGEIGIDYNEYCIYARNPYTDEIITPNSLAHLRTILSKYDVDNNILTADRIGNVRIYSDVKQLRQLQGLILSVDSIIRQMEYPSIFISDMVSDNPSITQLPGKAGILTVIKMSEDYVTVRFYDAETCSTFSGMYDVENHLFNGWIVEKGTGSVTEGVFEYIDGNLEATVPQDIGDLSIVTIRLEKALTPESLVNINDTGLCPIKSVYGKPLTDSIPANSIIMLIRDEVRNCWLYANTSQTTLNVITEIATERILSVQAELNKMKEDIEQLKTQNTSVRVYGNVYSYTVPEAGASRIFVQGFDSKADYLLVNLGQTLLRAGLDYVINNDGTISMKGVTLRPGTVIQFTALKGRV